MITFQDLQACTSEQERQEFILRTIGLHKGGEKYRTSQIARKYYYNHNPTIETYEKILYSVTGQMIPDTISPNHKLRNNMFKLFITQQVQFLLGNGITWNDEQPESLGEDFESKLIKAAKESLIGSVSYGFYNLDHIEIFTYEEYCPLYDENDGAMKAGIRFWQIDSNKPLRVTLYEIDGYTEYAWTNGKCEILQEKRPYIISYRGTEADGMKIYSGENYPGFPIVPLFCRESHESALVGHREMIDAYDLIMSGFANDLDEASQIYWLIQNAGGMDEVDLANFLSQIRRTHAAVVDEDGAKAEAHTIDIPHEAREAILTRLERDLFRDFMAFDPRSIVDGAVTATEITAGYEPLNSKTDEFENYITDFIKGILSIAGIDDDPSYTRSMIVNKQEEINNVLNAASYLPDDYVTRKILTILGDADLVDDILKQMDADELERMNVNAAGNVRRQENELEVEETGEEGSGNV